MKRSVSGIILLIMVLTIIGCSANTATVSAEQDTTTEAVFVEDTEPVSADNISPQKAAILLRLALACGVENDQLQDIFLKY